MRRWLTRVVIGLATGYAGCGGNQNPELVIREQPDGTEAGLDVVEGEAPETEPQDSTQEASEASSSTPETVIVGLEATSRTPPDGGTIESSELDALLMSMATGARGLTMERDWAELQGSGSVEAWGEIDSVGSLLRAQKRTMALSIRSVDATLDMRPGHLKGKEWTDSAVVSEMHALVDKLFETVRPELRYLSLGFEVDQYASDHPAEREAFVAFAAEAVRFANTRPNRPQSLVASVTWSHRAWTGAELPTVWASALMEASDVVMVSYAPMGDDLRAGPADSADSDLPLILQGATNRPVVFTGVSYPSSSLIGGSEESQAQFINILFAQVEANRAQVPFVAVNSLHDPSPERCLSKAEAQGHAGSAELYAYWCSTGLRTRDGTAKGAFGAFRTAAARLLEP